MAVKWLANPFMKRSQNMREDISAVQAASDRDTTPATGVTLEDKYAKESTHIQYI